MFKNNSLIFSFLAFFISYDAFSQNLNDANCPLSNMYKGANEERRFVVNPTGIQELTRKTSTTNDIPLAEEIFIQTAIEAADRLNKIGSGTFVYAGRTTITELSDDWDATCANVNTRHLIVIKTLASDNPNGRAAQLLPKCRLNGVPFGFQMEFYREAPGFILDPWYFSAPNAAHPTNYHFSMASIMIHEFGHAYRVEHPWIDLNPPIVPDVGFGAVMNTHTRILKEWDVRCMNYRSGARKYSLLYRNINSSGIGSEQVYHDTASSSVGIRDFAPGKIGISGNTNSLIYELGSSTKWHQNISSSTITDVHPPFPEVSYDTSFHVWNEETNEPPKYLWSQIDIQSGVWDNAWRIKLRTFIAPIWSPNNSSLDLLQGNNNAPIQSQFPPSIAHLNSPTNGYRTILIWSETNNIDVQDTKIASTIINSNTLGIPKRITYTLPNGLQGILNPFVPMSIACRSPNDLCIVVFIANDFYDASLVDPQGWRNKNVVMIGHLNLNDLINSSQTSTSLINVHELPAFNWPSVVRMRSASKPVVLYDGTNFRIIFRGSYFPGQKLTSFFSTNGLNWSHDSTFDNFWSPPFNFFNSVTSYSSVAPVAATHINGSTILYYSRPNVSFY